MSCDSKCPEKKVGHCTLCGTEVAEIVSQFPVGHPYAGHPVKIGKWKDTARKVVLVLTDGTTMDLTFCTSCADDVHLNLPAIWGCVLRAFAKEISPGYRANVNLPPYTAAQHETVQKWMLSMLSTVPLGVLHTEKRS